MSVPHTIPATLFEFTTTVQADLNTAILYAFGEANDRLETSLNIDDVRGMLREVHWYESVEDAQLTERLTALVRWNLLDAVQDNSQNYRTAEEYERRNFRYSLTKLGEAALAGIERAKEVMNSAGALQTSVLDAIIDRLTDLQALHENPATTDRQLYITWTELESHLEVLRGNTKQFNGQLQRLLRPSETDAEVFIDVKRATMSYLQEFCTNLDRRAEQIRGAVARLEPYAADVLIPRVLLGAELPPMINEDGRADWVTHRINRWQGLRAWFTGDRPRVSQLHGLARTAINTLLQVLERINADRRRASSAVTDFRHLARWFAAADTETDLHRLSHSAFGMASARHGHLVHEDPELIHPTTSWRDSQVRVSALLRTSGRTGHHGRPGRVPDTDAVRRKRRAAALLAQAEQEAAWRRLYTDGEIRLSQLGRLESETFNRLLDLLGRAIESTPDGDGSRIATSSDGHTRIRLRPPTDDEEATVVAEHGRMTGPNFRMTISGVGGLG